MASEDNLLVLYRFKIELEKKAVDIFDGESFAHIKNDGKEENDRKENDGKEENDRKKILVRRFKIVELLEADGSLTHKNLAQELKVSETTIQRDLRILQGMDIICRRGGKTHGQWIVNSERFH